MLLTRQPLLLTQACGTRTTAEHGAYGNMTNTQHEPFPHPGRPQQSLWSATLLALVPYCTPTWHCCQLYQACPPTVDITPKQPLQVLRFAAVRHLVAIKALSSLAGAVLQSVFSLMLQTHYGLGPDRNGMVCCGCLRV
jgi:hypothetical protein